MRALLLAVLAATLCAPVTPALGQQSRDERTEQDSREAAARARRLDRELQRDELPVPELANAGPCPFVKVLYDAARSIEFAGGAVSPAAVAWSGEIQGVTATCRYEDDEPIVVELVVTFAVGQGPQAQSSEKTFGYWVAVTQRNIAVLDKEQFSFTAAVPQGADRVLTFERIREIVIPRANANVSGANFEILVGFDVTPEMAEFNRQGSRFPVNATGRAAPAPSGVASAQ